MLQDSQRRGSVALVGAVWTTLTSFYGQSWDSPPFFTDSTASTDSSAMSEDLSSQPWSINKDDYELHEVIGM